MLWGFLLILESNLINNPLLKGREITWRATLNRFDISKSNCVTLTLVISLIDNTRDCFERGL